MPAPFLCTIALFSAAFLPNAQQDQGPSAGDLAKEVIAHEIQAGDQDHSHWEYMVESVKDGKRLIKQVIETKDGDLERVISINGQPLTAQQKKEEEEKIQNFLNDPGVRKKKQAAKQEDNRKTKELFAMFPQAFLYNYGDKNGDTVTLNFRPNPDFKPPTREAHVFHEMAGKMIVDAKQKRLVEISGQLMNEVKFAGGLFGHLDPGGKFDVKQTEVAPGHWDVSYINIDMKGKALLFKTLNVQEKEVHSQYHAVAPETTLAQGQELLNKKPSEAHP